MLYNEGDLTDNQAEQAIGEKMNIRIKVINDWMLQNGYYILMHSTFKSNVNGILSEEGLHYPKHNSVDTRDEILDDCAISEKDLDALENWVKKNKHNGKINKIYETNPPTTNDTATAMQLLSAKQLLEYNHRGGDVTVVFCVPKKIVKKIGRQNNFRMGFTQHVDPYLRRKITGKYQKNGDVEFNSEYFYPQEGILFVYDRANNKIKFNESFDEEFYLDDSCINKGKIYRGELFQKIRLALKSLDDKSIGRST